MTESTGNEDPRLVQLLGDALDQLDQGEQPNLEALTADRPDLLAPLRAAYEEVVGLPVLHRAAAEFDPAIDTVLGGRYRLAQRIGAGAMGVVYRAVDEQLGREVAVKRLRTELTAGSHPTERFEREARVLASVRHPAVVSVFDSGTGSDGGSFLVMELLQGSSVSDILREAPTDAIDRSKSAWLPMARERSYVREAVRWVTELARGLASVHSAGVIHRDVKPSNAFITDDGQPVLLDFGIVTLGPDQTVTQSDSVVGTPTYMAPEQLDPSSVPSARVDVYGLAATLYHLLTFHPPYQGTPAQILAALQRRDPVPARRLNPSLPRDLLAILDKGLSRRPRQRYATAEGLADDLEAWLDFRPVQARPVSPLVRRLRQAWRKPAIKTLLAVALFAVVALLGWTASQAYDDYRSRKWSERIARVPPFLLISRPIHRTVSESVDRELTSLLDELVYFADDDSLSRAIRASYSVDRGRFAAASGDLLELASRGDSKVCRTLAERTAALEANDGVVGPSLEDLPQPATDTDRLVLALHWVRAEPPDAGMAAELLRPIASRMDPVVDVLLMLADLMAKQPGVSMQERRKRIKQTHEQLIRLDAVRGRPTALSAHALGVVLRMQLRYAEAQPAIEAGLELAPFDFTLWTNLGGAYQDTWDTLAARQALARAVELQPLGLQAHIDMIRSMCWAGDFDEANEWIERAPFPAGTSGDRQRLERVGQVLLARAAAARAESDDEESERFANEAFQTLERARNPESKGWGYSMVLAYAYAKRDANGFAALTKFLHRDLLNARRLHNFALALPRALDEDQTMELRKVFLALSRELASRPNTPSIK